MPGASLAAFVEPFVLNLGNLQNQKSTLQLFCLTGFSNVVIAITALLTVMGTELRALGTLSGAALPSSVLGSTELINLELAYLDKF